MKKRSNDMEARYRAFLQQDLEPFSIRTVKLDFGDWLLIKNEFPYDNLYRRHDLLIPKQQVSSFRQLPIETQRHYHEILGNEVMEKLYDAYLVNMPKGRTVKTYWHCHCLCYL